MSTEYHNAGNSEAQQKQALAAMFAQSATPGIAKSGVLFGLVVSQTPTASGSVQISPGAGVVQGSLTAGASLLTGPDPTIDVLTANPVGSLPRYDIVAFDSVTAKVVVYVGTPNATPTDPTVPNTALKLARIRNAANATTIPNGSIDKISTATSLLVPTPDDTGWVNPGFTAASGFTIANQLARRIGQQVYLQLGMTSNISIGQIGGGDVDNTPLVNMPVGWQASQPNGALAGGPSGPDITAYASSTGTIIMTATGGALKPTNGFNVFGTYLLG